ncbi:hypothetical protein F4824DRAFT_506684 [Ustulina deusta]|nr:hypothetical protein F4824DRAFT_506684 [Ustulina deusta]
MEKATSDLMLKSPLALFGQDRPRTDGADGSDPDPSSDNGLAALKKKILVAEEEEDSDIRILAKTKRAAAPKARRYGHQG